MVAFDTCMFMNGASIKSRITVRTSVHKLGQIGAEAHVMKEHQSVSFCTQLRELIAATRTHLAPGHRGACGLRPAGHPADHGGLHQRRFLHAEGHCCHKNVLSERVVEVTTRAQAARVSARHAVCRPCVEICRVICGIPRQLGLLTTLYENRASSASWVDICMISYKAHVHDRVILSLSWRISSLLHMAHTLLPCSLLHGVPRHAHNQCAPAHSNLSRCKS